MINPFENEDAAYPVLTNDEGQQSLWPETVDVPAGWSTRHGPRSWVACLEYIEATWTDMRPNSLVAAMEKSQAERVRT